MAEVVEDMITLSNLTEESLLKNLQLRYANNDIYVSFAAVSWFRKRIQATLAVALRRAVRLRCECHQPATHLLDVHRFDSGFHQPVSVPSDLLG
jgi:hypothetical protein